MTPLQFDFSAYRNYVVMSGAPRLLVEGKDDKRWFLILFDSLGIGQCVEIDTADILRSADIPIGNREKVELVCSTARELLHSSRFVGFVDREFRGFELNASLKDTLERHGVSERLVWSRGHSIENYCFDFQVLREPLRDYSLTSCFRSALEEFERVFGQAIGFACALGLAATDVGSSPLVRKSLRWWHFRVCSGHLRFDEQEWRKTAIADMKAEPATADRILDRFAERSRLVAASDDCVVRWMCDGHLGMAAIWAVYAASVASVCEVAGVPNEASSVLGASEPLRANVFASSWARRAGRHHVTFPAEVVTMLGLGHALCASSG
jgi:hypothetical protein